MHELNIETRKKEELIEITDDVSRVVADWGIEYGACVVFVPHTTAGVTVNENADPDVCERYAAWVRGYCEERLQVQACGGEFGCAYQVNACRLFCYCACEGWKDCAWKVAGDLFLRV